MAAKRKAPPPPPESSSSEEVESSDEEQEQVAQPSPLKPNNSAKPAEPKSYSESGSEAESEPEPEPKSQNTPNKPAECDESSEEEQEEEEEEEEEEEKEQASKSQAEKPESEPDKKKLKAAAASPSQSDGKLKSRIWSSDDEMVLLQALSDFHSKNKRIPAPKEFDSFYHSINGKFNGAITVKQVLNKVRMFRDAYYARKKKGTGSALSNPHGKVLFEVSEKLWGDKNKTPAREEEPSQDVSDDEVSSGEAGQETENNGTVNNGDITNGGTMNGDVKVKDECEYPYLIEAIEELSKANQGMYLFFKKSFESLDESKARDFEARFKKLKYNEAKLSADKMEMTTKLAKMLTKLGK